MQPVAPKLEIMFSANNGEIVAELCAPNRLVDVRFKEERAPDAEGGPESHGSVCRYFGWSCRSRPDLALVAEVRFVQLGRGDSGVMISIDDVDFRWSLDSVRRISVRRHVEGLIGVFRIVEIVRHRELVRWINIPVEAAQRCLVADGMFDRLA